MIEIPQIVIGTYQMPDYDSMRRIVACAIKVGIPTKSGVGGGLLSVSDKRAGIGVFGPALDAQGNSIAGCKLLREISNELRLNLFYDPEWDKENEDDTVLKEMQARSVM